MRVIKVSLQTEAASYFSHVRKMKRRGRAIRRKCGDMNSVETELETIIERGLCP